MRLPSLPPCHAADSGRYDLEGCAFRPDSSLERFEQVGVGSIRNQDADLPAFKRLWPVEHNTERLRRLEIRNRLLRGWMRGNLVPKTKSFGDPIGQFRIDIGQVRQHA